MVAWPTPTVDSSDALAFGTVSGLRAIFFTTVGSVQLADSGSGLRMPVVGVNTNTAISGEKVIYVRHGTFEAASGIGNTWYSGYLGELLYVGSGGMIVLSGNLLSGQITQCVGSVSESGMHINISQPLDSRYIGQFFANNFNVPIRTIDVTNSPYNVTDGDVTILVDCSSGDVHINLPIAYSRMGRQYNIKRIDGVFSNRVTMSALGSGYVDNNASTQLIAKNQSQLIHCDGSKWWIV